MVFVLVAALAAAVGWVARGVHEETLRARRDLAEMFGPVGEPPSNVVPINSGDGGGLIA